MNRIMIENEPTTFTWDKLGDVSIGRTNLGSDMPVVIYRLLQFTMKETLLKTLSKDEAYKIFKDAGRMAGKSFYCELINDNTLNFKDFIAKTQQLLKDYKIGILRVESADLDNLNFTLTVSEDVDCSGLPVSGDTVCEYDEGFLEGILNEYTGKVLDVTEIDCWATGDRVCRFEVKKK